jgi:hypothetical protein
MQMTKLLIRRRILKEKDWTGWGMIFENGRNKSCQGNSFWEVIQKIEYTGWRRETGKFEVDYEIPPRGQVPSARGFVTLKRLVRL